jgi:hypothetical protein
MYQTTIETVRLWETLARLTLMSVFEKTPASSRIASWDLYREIRTNGNYEAISSSLCIFAWVGASERRFLNSSTELNHPVAARETDQPVLKQMCWYRVYHCPRVLISRSSASLCHDKIKISPTNGLVVKTTIWASFSSWLKGGLEKKFFVTDILDPRCKLDRSITGVRATSSMDRVSGPDAKQRRVTRTGPLFLRNCHYTEHCAHRTRREREIAKPFFP